MKQHIDVRKVIEQTGWGRQFLEWWGPARLVGGQWDRQSEASIEAAKRGSEPAASSLPPSKGTDKARMRAGSAQSGGGWPVKQQPIGEILKA
ncbi:hypothetical protein [Paenibacillus herberti]|uniref:hypothetical protein n=1 Tax=Paenibacillus herberti TaxID=1619309 RepID=UPI001FEADCBD|nr:hypothetical protein [Paenibacillus herberti]